MEASLKGTSMKIGMIGGIGHNGYVFDGVRASPGVEIVGVAPGPAEANADGLVRQSERIDQSPRVFGDYRAMLDAVNPDIVTVACHYADHAQVGIVAIKRGHHVFMEKPLATTMDDFNALRAAFDNADVQLSCMLGLRYDPAFTTAWRAVQHGAVGEVRLMTAQKSYKLGRRPEWNHDRDRYGGTIPWVGSHAIDWLHWFSGAAFERVYASHSTVGNDDHGELEATALCHFTMSNEVFGGVNMDYLRPPKAPTHGDDRIRVAGTGGVIEVLDGRVHLIDGQGPRDLPLEAKREIFAEFVDQVEGTSVSLISAEDAFQTTKACLLARQSADERRVVAF
jgi:predicted dehydrogenase